jgi:hypothetical protein
MDPFRESASVEFDACDRSIYLVASMKTGQSRASLN